MAADRTTFSMQLIAFKTCNSKLPEFLQLRKDFDLGSPTCYVKFLVSLVEGSKFLRYISLLNLRKGKFL